MAKRIERKVSKTAGFVCLLRAWSYYEKNGYYKSDDYLAPMFIPYFWKLIATCDFARTIIEKLFFTLKGGYEYIVSRTKLIDDIFRNLSGNVEQVLILGAGFDSRAIRFSGRLNGARIFELDEPMTQQVKIGKLKRNNIELPSNLKFISIDFDNESLPRKLDESGFRKNRNCFYILEGLTYYLDKASIHSTFNLLKEYSGKNSVIVFDYLYSSVVRRENLYEGEEKLYRAAARAGERFLFGIEKGHIREFLAKYGFELIDEFDSHRLEQRFFTDEKGENIAPVLGIYSIVSARKI